MKARHFLVMSLVSGGLLFFGQTVFALPVLVSDEFHHYKQRQDANSGYFSQVMVSRDCGQGIPTRQIREHDLTPLIIAWLASICRANQARYRPVQERNDGAHMKSPELTDDCAPISLEGYTGAEAVV